MSATLFNLKYVIRKIKKGTLRTSGSPIVAYADVVMVITKRKKKMIKLKN